MRRQVLLSLVLGGGCGFHSSGAANDASPIATDTAVRDDASGGPIDAALDASTDAMVPPATCWQHWLDHSVVVHDAAELTGLSTTGTERDPWISEDQLRLYFWRQGLTGTADGYLATRATPTDPFTTAAKLDGFSLEDRDEGRMSLTRDELMIAVSSNLGGSSQFDIRIATRARRTDAFRPLTSDHLMSVNTASTQHFDPFLSGDGLHLYLAPVPTGVPQHLALATRSAIDGNFSQAALLTVINTTELGAGDSDPALSPDERVIVFSSNRLGGVGGGDLYYATRTNAGQPFGPPALVPTVNSLLADGDPVFTADGCTLYFASLRSGNFNLYTATVDR